MADRLTQPQRILLAGDREFDPAEASKEIGSLTRRIADELHAADPEGVIHRRGFCRACADIHSAIHAVLFALEDEGSDTDSILRDCGYVKVNEGDEALSDLLTDLEGKTA